MPSALVNACGSAARPRRSTPSTGRIGASRSGTWRRRFRRARPRERRRIVRGAFAHFGRLLFELLKFSTLSPEAMLARVEFEGEERVRAAYAHGKGVLFVTGHFGFWELQAMVHALRLPPMAVMARALDNPALNELLEHMRTRTGNSVIYRQGTIRRVMRQLQAGEGVGDPDRSAHPEPRRDLRGLLQSARRRRRRRSRRWRCEPARASCRCSRCRSAAGATG